MRLHCLKPIAFCTLLGPLLASSCIAETPDEVLLRLERGRSNDALEEKRRQETLEWQRRRKEQEYSARWKRYGDFEVDMTQWQQQKDGVWITVAKYGLLVEKSGGLSWPYDLDPPQVPPSHRLVLPEPQPLRVEKRSLGDGVTAIAPVRPPKRFDQALDEMVRQGVVTPKERCLFSSDKSVCKPSEMNSWIAVSCGSLHFSRKPAGQPWEKWERPREGSVEERLVVDRCASLTDRKEEASVQDKTQGVISGVGQWRGNPSPRGPKAAV